MFQKKLFVTLGATCVFSLSLMLGTTQTVSADVCESVFRQTFWSLSTTWSCGHVPTSADTVVIQTNHPILLDTTGYADSLAIDGSLTVQNSNALFVQGNFANNGTFDAGTGRVVKTEAGSVSGTTTFNDFYVNDGLVGYWKLDEGGGFEVLDSSGYANHGTLSLTNWNNHAPTNFSNTYSMETNDSSSAIIPDAPSLQPTSFTISGWFNWSQPDGLPRVMVSKYRDAGVYSYLLFWDDDNLQAMLCDNNGCDVFGYVPFAPTLDTWYQVVMTFDDAADEIRVYLNGALVTLGATGRTPFYTNEPLRIGGGVGGPNGFRFQGFIDDVRLYDRALSATEIAALAAGNHPDSSIATTALNSALDINGALVINSGTLDVSTNNIALAGNFQRNGGVFTPNTQTVTFDGAGTQTIDTDGMTFHHLAVNSGVLLNETEPETLTLSGSLTNSGTIRKARTITDTGIKSFGLTGVSADVTTQGSLTSLQVDRIDADAPNQLPGYSTAKYWNITAEGGSYLVNLTLPHNNLTDPRVCRYTAGTNWNCARTTFSSGTVTRNGVNNFSTWEVLNQAPTNAALLTFQGKVTAKNSVKLKWETGSELGIIGFHLWRKQGKAEWKQVNAEWIAAKDIGSINGAAYEFTDKKVKVTKRYHYKLELVNANGTSEWSEALRIRLR